MDKSEILFQHYNASVEELNRELRLRLKLMWILMGLAILLQFKAAAPQVAQDLLNKWIRGQIPDASKVDLAFVSTILIFALCSVLAFFYARSLSIERQTRYLRTLEERLNTILGHELITRFSDSGRNRPLYFRFGTYLTTGLMVVLVVVTLGVAMFELADSGHGFFRTVDWIMVSLITFATVFFLASFFRLTRAVQAGNGQ